MKRIRTPEAELKRLEQAQVRYHENIDKERARGQAKAWVYRCKKFFGCDPERKYNLLAVQGGKCAICGTDTPNGNRGWCMDADHDQNPPFIRGVLCNRCNLGLGYFAHNPKHLKSAADYIAMRCQ